MCVGGGADESGDGCVDGMLVVFDDVSDDVCRMRIFAKKLWVV